MTLTEMRAKFPTLFAEYERIKAERDAFNELHVLPLRKQRDALIAEMTPFVEEERALAERIKAEQTRLAEFDRQVSGLIAAMGGRLGA
jgi:hypothetical protein